jgi:aryl-alcohol dehydrogenase-like predicted oxidoreductase
MQERTLGRQGLRTSAIGLGCMGMSDMYGPADEAESIATVHRALELGVTLLDTADVYGFGHNERLLAKAIAGRRDEAVIATKCGIVRKADDHAFFAVDGSPDYIPGPATAPSSASASTRSTSITCTASIRRCRSTRASAR